MIERLNVMTRDHVAAVNKFSSSFVFIFRVLAN